MRLLLVILLPAISKTFSVRLGLRCHRQGFQAELCRRQASRFRTTATTIMAAPASASASRPNPIEESINGLEISTSMMSDLPTQPCPVPLRQISPTPGVIFCTSVPLQPISSPLLISHDAKALSSIGISPLPELWSPSSMASKALAPYVSGSCLIPRSLPSSHCYCGHQFGSFSGQLGDGATLYLANVIHNSKKTELQLKGAGKTPYSRTADGRKVLRSSIREHVCSKYMDSLGIPTTLSPTLVVGKDEVVRDKFYDGRAAGEPVGVISRSAETFFRFGSFEICKPGRGGMEREGSSPNDVELGRKLFDYIATNYFGESKADVERDRSGAADRVMRRVVSSTARLVAAWRSVGFTHGVLNTDNMSIVGLTIDYGPFGFMEYYEGDYIPNGSDGTGRYDFDGQEKICRWNLEKLAEAWEHCGVANQVAMKEVVEEVYGKTFREEWSRRMRGKLGLQTAKGGDDELFLSLLEVMESTKADFTETFVTLEKFVTDPDASGDFGSVMAESCAGKAALMGMCEKKLKILRPTTSPEQTIALWEMCQKDPQGMADHFGAPVEALVNEIRGDYEKLEKYAG